MRLSDIFKIIRHHILFDLIELEILMFCKSIGRKILEINSSYIEYYWEIRIFYE